MRVYGKPGQVLPYGQREITLEPACQHEYGFWVCLTCEIRFWDGFQMESHAAAEPGEHVVGWNCDLHGPEAP
jgi:hypothetical protein